MASDRSGMSAYLKVGDIVEVRRGDYAYHGTVVGCGGMEPTKVFIKDREGMVEVVSLSQVAKK